MLLACMHQSKLAGGQGRPYGVEEYYVEEEDEPYLLAMLQL